MRHVKPQIHTEAVSLESVAASEKHDDEAWGLARRLCTRAKGLRIAKIAMTREAYCSPYDSDTRRRRRRMGMKFSGTPCQL